MRRLPKTFNQKVDKRADFSCEVAIGDEMRREALPKRTKWCPIRHQPQQCPGVDFPPDGKGRQ